ncbi:MAG: pilus assembly protein N-terminal domain-containing protein [Alphaproteobacteria bacterium]
MAKGIDLIIGAAAGLALMGMAVMAAGEQKDAKIRAPLAGGQQIEFDAAELSGGQAGRSINLPEGKARLINFPVEVGKVLVADPAVADVVVMSSRQIYLIGLSAGATNAFFLDDEEVELLRLEIQVQLDVAAANKSLKTLLPRADIKITAIKSHLFLTGSVRSVSVSRIAQVIASRFVAKDANVINMLMVLDDQSGKPKLPPVPAIAPVTFEKADNKPYKVKIYRATAPSTALIGK